MTRRQILRLAGAAALALVVAALPAAAFAKDGDSGEGKGKGKGKGAQKDDARDKEKQDKQEKKDPKDTAEGRECSAVGGEFQRKDSAALAARVRPKGKLRLNLSGTSAEYGEKQASGVLDEWFQDKELTKVELRAVKDLQGELAVTFRARGSDKSETRTLLVTLEKKDKGEGFWLSKLELLQ